MVDRGGQVLERLPTIEEYETLIQAVGWAKYTNLEATPPSSCAAHAVALAACSAR
jgi:hypothetical protein